jgi:UDP-GlcNAc:undecaprenyl-phosphate GlcNAc-1-phosphate transferase
MLLENQLLSTWRWPGHGAGGQLCLMTPVVKTFAYKVGAIDVPKDARRMHHDPHPPSGRSGHIFIGFSQHSAVRRHNAATRCRAF